MLIENFLEHIIWSGFLENDIGNLMKAFNENPENFHKKKIVFGIAFIFYVYTQKVLVKLIFLGSYLHGHALSYSLPTPFFDSFSFRCSNLKIHLNFHKKNKKTNLSFIKRRCINT